MNDPEVRRKYRNDPKATYRELRAQELGDNFPALADDVEIKVVTNTPDTFYVVFHEVDDEQIVSEQDLRRMQAADTASTAGTIGTASSLGSVCGGTISSLGSASTIGSAGSNG